MNERLQLESRKRSANVQVWVSAATNLAAAFDQSRSFLSAPVNVGSSRKLSIAGDEADGRHCVLLLLFGSF